MKAENGKPSIDPLDLRIYTAMLGAAPRVWKVTPLRSLLKWRVQIQSRMLTEVISPFHVPTLRENIERAAAGAVHALNNASERLKRTRAKVHPPVTPSPTNSGPLTPIVLVGPSRSTDKRDSQAA